MMKYVYQVATAWNNSKLCYNVSASLNIMLLVPFALAWWDMSEYVAGVLFISEFATLFLLFVDAILRVSYTRQ